MITEEKIARINALAQKSRTPQGLTPEEKQEQAALRREYVEAVRRSLQGQLDHTTILRPNGEREKLRKKDRSAGK